MMISLVVLWPECQLNRDLGDLAMLVTVWNLV